MKDYKFNQQTVKICIVRSVRIFFIILLLLMDQTLDLSDNWTRSNFIRCPVIQLIFIIINHWNTSFYDKILFIVPWFRSIWPLLVNRIIFNPFKNLFSLNLLFLFFRHLRILILLLLVLSLLLLMIFWIYLL